jgi:hypothetical protein
MMRVMPFGKFKSQPLAALPNYYLSWLLDQHWLQPPLAGLLLAEYDRRHQHDAAPEPDLPLAADPLLVFDMGDDHA